MDINSCASSQEQSNSCKIVILFLTSNILVTPDNVDYVGIQSRRLKLTFPADPFSQPTSGGRICLNVTVLEDGLLEEEEMFMLILQSSEKYGGGESFVSGK